MTASPHWYPVAAVGTLFLTGVVVLGTSQVQKLLEQNETSKPTVTTRLKRRLPASKRQLLDAEKANADQSDRTDIPARPPPSPGYVTPNDWNNAKPPIPTIRITQSTPTEGRNSYSEKSFVQESSSGVAIIGPPEQDEPPKRINMARVSRIPATEVGYYVGPISLSEQEMDLNRVRARETGNEPQPHRDSQHSFLMRRNITTDMYAGPNPERTSRLNRYATVHE